MNVPASIAEAHQVASRAPRFGDVVHVVLADGHHVNAEVKDDVLFDLALRHYVLDGAPGSGLGMVPFAMSREPGSWHWPGGYGCER
jgi:hypothetical protein